MENLKNIHPGEILKEEFLVPLNISAYRLAKETFIPQTRVGEILKGNRRITADTAIRLAKYFGTSAKFWLSLQDDYDIEDENQAKKQEYDGIKAVVKAAWGTWNLKLETQAIAWRLSLYERISSMTKFEGGK